MILIITRKDDVHADLVIEGLSKLKANYFRLNTECIYDYDISLSHQGGYIYNIKVSRKVKLDEIKSIYLRRRSVPENTRVDEEFKKFTEQEWVCFQKNIWERLGKKFWISLPAAIEKASNKLNQLHIAKQVGFLVPETIFTNSINEVMGLQKKYGKCIYKPHDGGFISPSSNKVIYTNILENRLTNSAEMKKSLSVCPGIFQPYIDKAYEIRATVVGNKIFATKIDSQKSDRTRIDWRRYDFQNVPHYVEKLPEAEGRKCIEIVKGLGLRFGAIDIIVTPKNQYYFLEINANGQWAWIEALTKQQISLEIAHLLVYHNN